MWHIHGTQVIRAVRANAALAHNSERQTFLDLVSRQLMHRLIGSVVMLASVVHTLVSSDICELIASIEFIEAHDVANIHRRRLWRAIAVALKENNPLNY